MLDGLDPAQSCEDQCAQLAKILGLDQPVSPAVLEAALRDPLYVQNLLVSRGEPRFLDRLLANPPATPAEGVPTVSELLAEAAKSLGKWAMTGFSTVSEERYGERLAACQACPHLRRPPENRRVLYAAAGAKRDERSLCGKCGCVVSAKARRPHDTCPDPHPTTPGVNRWGDRRQPEADNS